ncbi:MAG: M4 family metallopeptidase [Acidobacteria bacterium]|nr:M4 family metallopeptidase [Acidobacteriota bacterium]
MRIVPRLVLTSVLAGTALIATGQHVTSQQPGVVTIAAGYAVDLDTLRQWDKRVDGLMRTGDLIRVSRMNDPSVEGRTHEYLAQHYEGVPVHGGGVSRQLDGAGVTVSLFGTLHQGIDVVATPGLSESEVAVLLERMLGAGLVAGEPSLGVLPLPDGSYALAYRVAMSDGFVYFVDAGDGRVLHRVHARMMQAAIGAGTNFQGKRRKLSTTFANDRFEAFDAMRPAEIVTLDLRFNNRREDRLFEEHMVDDLPPGERVWTSDDIAADADNDWDDPAVVDAHAYSGWFYDYLFARHGWAGVDGANGRILLMVNDPDATAYFGLPPYGPEGTGVFNYGRLVDESSEQALVTADIVGHEMMHAVTHFSVSNRTGDPFPLLFTQLPVGTRLGPKSLTDYKGDTYTCPTARFRGLVMTPDGFDVGLVPAWCVDGRFLLASSHGGAIHESYSDIFGESLEFYYEDEDLAGDYLLGGELEIGPFRSLSDPRSIDDGFFPDAYGDRYEFALTLSEEGYWDYSGFVFVDGQYYGATDWFGYGGDHWNSLFLSHAFYLAIEGGTHRSTGATVEGVGGGHRAEIERIFFRAMRDLMPAAASLPIAADVIRQSAADLAPGGNAQRAIDQALRAVGLLP